MRYILHIVLVLISFISVLTVTAQTNLSSELDQIYSSAYPASGAGCAVLVARKGEVIYRKAFGMANLELKVPMTAENVFRIASLTKQFTSVAILQLHEKGLLNIEDDIKKYIPDFPSVEKISIANLMSHTSGIKNITDTDLSKDLKRKKSTPTELVEIIKKLPSDFKPGTEHRYSNSGYLLLGYIIEKASGKPYDQYIADNIFKPLKMDRAYYDHPQQVVPGRASGYVAVSEIEFANADFLDQSFPYAAGALMMSVDDMYKWNKGLYTYTILKKETLEKAFEPFTLLDGGKPAYGFGWGLDSLAGMKARQHGGGIDGFSTFVAYMPTEDLFVVTFSNVMNKSAANPTILAAAMAANKITPVAISSKTMDRYVGTYRFPDNHDVKIYKENGVLFLKDGNSPVPWKMYFTNENNFYCREVFPNNHLFTTDRSGKVDAFVIQLGRQELKIKRIN